MRNIDQVPHPLSQVSPELPKASGNTILEYSSIGVAVLLVCIGVMITVGGNFDSLLKDLKTEMQAKTNASKNAQIAVQVSLPAQPHTVPRVLASQTLRSTDIALLKTDLATQIQTAGANGTTQLYADQIGLLAQKLLAEGGISPEQHQLLMQLANQGHKIADIERALEDALKQAGNDLDRVGDSKISYNNRSYSSSELFSLIGFNNTDAPSNLLDTTSALKENPGTELKSLLSLMQSVQKSSIMQNPEAQATVNTAIINIIGIAESVQHVLNTQDMSQNVRIQIAEGANDNTHKNAKQICTTGDYTDNGFSCTK